MEPLDAKVQQKDLLEEFKWIEARRAELLLRYPGDPLEHLHNLEVELEDQEARMQMRDLDQANLVAEITAFSQKNSAAYIQLLEKEESRASIAAEYGLGDPIQVIISLRKQLETVLQENSKLIAEKNAVQIQFDQLASQIDAKIAAARVETLKAMITQAISGTGETSTRRPVSNSCNCPNDYCDGCSYDRISYLTGWPPARK